MREPTRREFITAAALAAGSLPFIGATLLPAADSGSDVPLDVHIFSKHLQFLSWSEAGAAASKMGFAGVDLTVRPDGHVEPLNVRTDLPKAVQSIRDAGSRCTMITTAIEDVNKSTDEGIITTAASAGIRYYRINWFRYPERMPMTDAVTMFAGRIAEMSALNKKLGITGCYQNHAGTNVGSSFWEVHQLLKGSPPEAFGAQFDICHAMVEGGNSWKNGVTLLLPRIATIVLKDFRWEKLDGRWTAVNVPVGEGMVDFTRYFRMLKYAGLRPPVSLHVEYDLGGAEKGNRIISVDRSVVFRAMEYDLKSVQRLWKEA